MAMRSMCSTSWPRNPQSTQQTITLPGSSVWVDTVEQTTALSMPSFLLWQWVLIPLFLIFLSISCQIRFVVVVFYFHLRLSVFAFLVPVMQDLKDACVVSMCICSVMANFCFNIYLHASRTMIHHWYGLVLRRHCRVICWCLKLSAHDWRAECCTVVILNRAKKKYLQYFFLANFVIAS